MLSKNELEELERLLYEDACYKSKSDLLTFTKTTFAKYQNNWHAEKFYDILNRFAKKEIKNLIVSMPPQHGKSEGSSRRLPSFIAGIRPDDKLAIVCYASTKAQKFGREIMSIMRERVYKDIFPNVMYPERGYTGTRANTNETRESINSEGSMKFVGVDGPLTGDTIDVLIMDDLYKNWQEGNSPVTQKKVWEWYMSVADTRLHNDSQQLIVFTRWSENDLISQLEDAGKVVEWKGDREIEEVIAELEHDYFLKINFQAIKEGEPNLLDPRKPGQSLWENMHSLNKLKSSRDKDPDMFDCLYQGNPVNKEGLLYGSGFKVYSDFPEFRIIKNYTDTADTGKDKLCSIVYGVPLSRTDEHLYVLDVVYTDKPMEVTEPMVANMLLDSKVNKALVESNNGGRGFARNVKALVHKINQNITIDWFYQGKNKESRIYSNSATVKRKIVFPDDWHIKWPDFYKDITKYKKDFSMNEFHDGPDVLTGIIETETKRTGEWGSSSLH